MARLLKLCAASTLLCALATTARADLLPAATYLFQNSLNAQEPGAPALTPVDPLGTNGFVTDTLYGQTRQVYAFNGNPNPPAEQAGLTLDTTGLVAANNYSVELVFEFSQRDGAYRRIVDVQNRQSDSGFYVDPGNNLQVYPVGAGTTAFTTGVYHDVVLTDSSSGVATAYLDGHPEFAVNTTLMDISNPGNLMNFFLDNVVGGGIGEFSDGRIGLVRLYNGVLGADQVARNAANPFPGAVPEPSSLVLLGVGGLVAMGYGRRRFKRSA